MNFLGRWDIILPLLVLAFFFFGAKRLPELGSAVGKTIKEFQKSMSEVTDSVKGQKPAVPAPQPQPELAAPAASTPDAAATATPTESGTPSA